ncbi:SDR family oxidoreductase [Streptomyces solisilvae]|uniref:SDR family oxidoreductase n=1 Tax=Streptomyces malaysiensis TaxID=92644 RepID=UPI003685D1BE
MKIEGSIGFVTGASRGLGLAFARELLERGASKVYAGVRNPDGFDEAGVVPVKVDVNDSVSVREAVKKCSDVTLLINNAGIVQTDVEGVLDKSLIERSRAIFETNFYGMIRASQAFAPVITRNGGGAIVNVLSDATWFSRPVLASYSASKSAAWSFTNALRTELRETAIQIVGLHVGFIDTDMTREVDTKKSDPRDVAAAALSGLENNEEEVLADESTRALKQTLSTSSGYYLNPQPLPGFSPRR